MTWVRSEYAPELAVVSAWLSALLPWYVGYTPWLDPVGRFVVFRFQIVQVRYFLDLQVGESIDLHVVAWPWKARTFYSGTAQYAIDLWMVGAVPILLAAALGVAMYVDLETVEAAIPVDVVRVVGSLLTLGAVVHLAASAILYVHSPWGEYPFPIGALIVLALGIGLLTVERVEVDEESADESDGGEANAGGDASADPNREEGIEEN